MSINDTGELKGLYEIIDGLRDEHTCNICVQYRKTTDRLYRHSNQYPTPYWIQAYQSGLSDWERHCIAVHERQMVPNIPREYQGAFAD